MSGALLEQFWWGSAFLVNIPVIIVTAVAVAMYSPESRRRGDPLDPRGALLSLTGLGALLFAIIEGPERGWTDPFVVTTFVAAAALITLFVLWERIAEHPMLPLRFFTDRRFSVGSAVVTTSFFVMFGFFFLFSMYLQFARGYSPLDAGLATLPMAATFMIVSPRSAGLVERLGSGTTITVGFLIIAAGMGGLAFVGVGTPYLALVAVMILLATGMSVVAAPATTGIMSSVPLAKAGVGSAMNDTTREVGGALGIAVFGSIVNSGYGGVDVGGLDLRRVRRAGRESAGAAGGAAQGGAALVDRAATAFTDAMNVTAMISMAMLVVAAVVVSRTFTRAKEAAAITASANGRDSSRSSAASPRQKRPWTRAAPRSVGRTRASSARGGSCSRPRSRS